MSIYETMKYLFTESQTLDWNIRFQHHSRPFGQEIKEKVTLPFHPIIHALKNMLLKSTVS